MLGRSGAIRLWINVFLICISAAAFGQPVGIVTVAEGGVELVRGTATYSAVPGVAVQNGDMLAVDAKGQVQIEFDDGAILNLARGSHALLLAAQGPNGEPGVTLQSGWVKFTRVKASKGKLFRYVTPLARLSTVGATGVLRIGPEASELFIESGAARFVELSKGGAPGSGRDFKGGEFVVRRDGQALSVAPHPSAEFVKAMPGYFRDDLPVFLPRVRNRNVEPRREHEATYAEVEVWLRANLPTRRGLAERFQSRVKDAQFRGKLIENLAAHPEWEPVLFPEKYEKKKEDEEAAAAEKAEKAKRVQ